MTTLKKKIRKEAHRNKLGIRDLEHAVKAIQHQSRDEHIEALLHKEAILNEETRLWEVAGDVVQYGKEVGEW